MIGYELRVWEIVVVEGDRTTTIDVLFAEATHNLDEVVVSAKRMNVPLSTVSIHR